ncbi:hypothetical protein, partial [Mariprofundus ferrooxydans]|uniref:hypothetical protein n=1 Tax=Mariprofundus ferrooxydans TaxID=314344 RepID=UPI0018CA95E2
VDADGRLVNSDGHLVDADGRLVDAGSYAAYAWSKGFIENKTPTLTQRRDAVLIALRYLRDHPVGTGAGLGMTTVNYAIAVGYANAALESGVLGGICYVLMFLLLTWFAIKMIWNSSLPADDNKVRIAIGLSALTCILMGMQRQQPDLSFWHMWIYAALIYLTLKSRSEAPPAV